jgi:hypothetical protein
MMGVMMRRKDSLQAAEEEIADYLTAISTLFTRPEEVKITLLARTPWIDGSILMTEEQDIEQAIAEIRRLAQRKAQQ